MTPRMMVDNSKRDLSIELFGLKLPSPLFMAPIGVTGLCTQDSHGDLAAARASVLTRVPMMATTLSNDPLETVAATLGDMPGFFQLYTPKDKAFAESLIQRAEAAGFKGIVVSLDAWDTGWRPRDLASANFPQLRGHVLANYTSDPVFQKMLGKGCSNRHQGRGAALVCKVRKSINVGRHALAEVNNKVAADLERHMPSRRCASCD